MPWPFELRLHTIKTVHYLSARRRVKWGRKGNSMLCEGNNFLSITPFYHWQCLTDSIGWHLSDIASFQWLVHTTFPELASEIKVSGWAYWFTRIPGTGFPGARGIGKCIKSTFPTLEPCVGWARLQRKRKLNQANGQTLDYIEWVEQI